MSLLGYMVVLLMGYALYHIYLSVTGDLQAERWLKRTTYSMLWIGVLRYTGKQAKFARTSNTTLLVVLLCEVSKKAVVFEVHETFPALSQHAKERVVETLLIQEQIKPPHFIRFHTTREMYFVQD